MMAKKDLSKLQAKTAGFERVVVAVKPDGVKRALVGEVVRRMEQVGLKIIAAKMLVPTTAQAKGNYPDPETVSGKKWVVGLGQKTLKTYTDAGQDVAKELGTNNPLELGMTVYENLIKYLTEGPMVVIVWEGHEAVSRARVIAGDTTPIRAERGTLRGDLSFDSQILGNIQGRVVLRNVLHVSGDKEEALEEMAYWFGDDYEFKGEYIRSDHLAMFGKI
jgi:nucleoside-diphosphate kinase